MGTTPRASDQATIEALLATSPRPKLTLHNAFVLPAQNADRPPPLSRFVSTRRERTLRQYLIAHAVISSEGTQEPPWSTTRDSRVWARALRLADEASTSRTSVSKGWEWLEREKLIRRQRSGRLSTVQLLSDAGDGKPYSRPTQRFFQLPYIYWLDEWDRRLALPELAVLLIGLHLKNPFELTPERDQKRFGISRSSLAAGLRGLEQKGVLSHVERHVEAPLAPAGVKTVRRYTFSAEWKAPDPEAAVDAEA